MRSLDEVMRLAREAATMLDGASGAAAAAARSAVERLLGGRWTVLVSGLRSTGKSSLVCSLWGDSALLPTAVRDCTQTNTLVRTPRPGEADRRVVLRFLDREQAMDYASRDLSCHRLEELVREVCGPLGREADAADPARRVRWLAATARKLFAERADVHVLHEPLTEQLEKVEQFLEFLETPEYRPGGEAEVSWVARAEYLMGHRRPDGRTLDVGKLLSLRLVEIVRQSDRWGDAPPNLIDSPWIPTFHNARRADLILREAKDADMLVITALPEPLELEPWVDEAFRLRPELARRTVVVFNQVDTVDTTRLFSRGGFAEAWRENLDRLAKRGVRPENVLCACARLAFLQGLPPQSRRPGFEAEREIRLQSVLASLARLCDGHRPAGGLTERLAAACDPTDAGVASLRARLLEMSRTELPAARASAALSTMTAVDPVELDAAAGQHWVAVRKRAAELLAGGISD